MAPFLEKLLPYVIFSILALAGVATAVESTSAGIFIAILVLALLGAAATLFQKFLLKKVLKSSNSYQVCLSVPFISAFDITNDPFQINVQSDGSKKSGIANAGFDVEKGGREGAEKSVDKLAGNYVPYGQYPAIPSVKEAKEEVKAEGKEEEKWKGAYVPYQEDNKEESQ